MIVASSDIVLLDCSESVPQIKLLYFGKFAGPFGTVLFSKGLPVSELDSVRNRTVFAYPEHENFKRGG